MALAFTSLAAASTDTSNTSSYAGTSGNPANGDLLIACAMVSDTVAAGSMSGGGWTWNKLTSFTKNSGLDTFYIFWARATGTTATAPTMDVTGDNGTGASIHCWRVTGQEGGGAPYLRQMKTATGSSANPAITMDSAILTGNGCISFVCNGTNSAAQFTAPTSWATAIANSYNTPTNGLASSSRASGETGSTITWTCANTTAWGLILMEFYVSGTCAVPLDGACGVSGINANVG
jgi:hypothetical protein